MADTNQKILEQRAVFLDTHVRPVEDALAAAESPIETLMLWALLNARAGSMFRHAPRAFWSTLSNLELPTPENAGAWWIEFEYESAHLCLSENLYLVPQVDVSIQGKGYRLDLVIMRSSYLSPSKRIDTRVALECDGHDFHEKTREQARRDKARDRALQTIGLHVARFTGSEIYRDADAAAQEALSFVTTLHEASVRSAGGRKGK